MNCRDYVFKLSSGQLNEDASASDRLGAALHRLSCRYCRAFTHNDAALSRILAGLREDMQRPHGPADKGASAD